MPERNSKALRLPPRRKFLAIAACSLLGAGSLPAFSQIQSDPKSKVVLTRLLQIIDQVGIIIPGQGFKSIKLGEPVEKLVQLWGPPKSVNRKGTLSYLLSFKTTIHFLVKKNRIKSIAVIGKVGSLAHVNNGVVFGMTQGQVLGQFATAPDKHNSELIRYKALGIELGFESDTLAEIGIFEPKR